MCNPKRLQGSDCQNGFASTVTGLVSKPFTSAYRRSVGNYDDVFVQLANIFTAFHLGGLSILLMAVCGVFVVGWPATVLACAVGVLSYLCIGKLYNTVGNKGLGLIAAAHAGWLTAWTMAVWQPLWLTATGTIVAAAATYWLAYPLAYMLVRAGFRHVLDNRLGIWLVDIHDRALAQAEMLLGR